MPIILPIIVLNAHAMVEHRAAGGDDFDTKPIQFEGLVGKIDALLKEFEFQF
jgi:DNA-binding response OmpR family regulator